MALVNHCTGTQPKVLWTVGAVTGRIRGNSVSKLNVRPFCRGKLVGVEADGKRKLYFVGRRITGLFCLDLNCQGSSLSHEARTFCEFISIYDRDNSFLAEFRIPGGKGAHVFQQMREMKHGGGTEPPALPA